ncbi:hypothetical protein L6164_017855 [Bauhinia variegata]|uniref:Uncharacterized protein n=1 Tax=Bauhinia variegata TaxID=167791 RepID=A0ACB9N964_BAUVA|nr:hypothetical protein L6164_017855 [Bauhinia variegata]
MAHFSSCGELSLLPTHIAFLRYLNRILYSIKHDVAQVLAGIFCFQPNVDRNVRKFCEEDLLSSSAKDLMTSLQNECYLEAQAWSPIKKNFGDKQGPYAVFNALDSMLKDSLDRLKMMREGDIFGQDRSSGIYM